MRKRAFAVVGPSALLIVMVAIALAMITVRAVAGAQDESPTISPAKAPAGTEARPVQWVDISAPGVGVMLAAAARPAGPGPFPTAIVLHGTHGLAQEYVQLAQDLAREGFLAVAPCWFTGGGGLGARFVTPIACPSGPAMPGAASPEAIRIVDGLVKAVRTMPGVRPDRIALVGHSRGGGAAVHAVLGANRAQAVVLDSTGYPSELTARASDVRAPILILHGTKNSADEGGSPLSNVEMARSFEAALRKAGKTVDAFYYDGAGHNGIFTSSSQYKDEVTRMTAFLRRHLKP